MSDAGSAFRELRDSAGGGYDARLLHADLEAVEHRVERARAWRAVKSTALGLVLVAGGAVLATHFVGGDTVAPAHSPSSSPTPSVSATAIDVLSLPCTSPTVIAGKPVGDLGGFEGWFNATSTSPMCDSMDSWTEWEHLIAAHPDTVHINTIDNTMIEAYYRTTIDALGVYATLSGDFKVPDPDPNWPAESAVLIDARTGEVLESERFDEMEGFDITTGHFETQGAEESPPGD